jgi:hypothetical protein
MKKVLVGLSIAVVCAIIIVATVLAVVLTTSGSKYFLKDL